MAFWCRCHLGGSQVQIGFWHGRLWMVVDTVMILCYIPHCMSFAYRKTLEFAALKCEISIVVLLRVSEERFVFASDGGLEMRQTELWLYVWTYLANVQTLNIMAYARIATGICKIASDRN